MAERGGLNFFELFSDRVQMLVGVELVRVPIADEPEYRLCDTRSHADDHHAVALQKHDAVLLIEAVRLRAAIGRRVRIHWL